MKISEYKKLEEKINKQDFNKSYKNLNKVMFGASIFGHFASIFLAYFMLSRIVDGASPDSPVFVFVFSVIVLSLLELLKRDLFDKFSIQYLKAKSFTKDVIPLAIIGLFIVSLSFYSSVNGAKEFSTKTTVIETNKKEIITKYSDSLNLVYNTKMTYTESEIKADKSKLDIKDKEQTDIEAIGLSGDKLTKTQKNRVVDLKEERKLLKDDIVKLEGDISKQKDELNNLVKQKEKEVLTDTDKQKNENKSNTIAFVIISTLIELVILAGVYFNEYYKFRSYNEERLKKDKDVNYQRWILYEKILEIIYSEDYKLNQKISSSKSIIDLCKVNDLLILPKDLINFFKVMSSIGIIKTSGSARYINKERDLAFELLKKHFKIE